MKVLFLLPALILVGNCWASDPIQPKQAALPRPPSLDLKAVAPQKRGVVVMPAIGSPGQSQPPTAQNIIRIGNGSNEIVYVGVGFLNRIATPFQEPRVIEASGLEFTRVGQDVYFNIDRDGSPIGIFIADAKARPGTNSVASLTLIPRAGLPGQNIMLVMEGVSDGFANGQAQDPVAPPADYTDAIKQLMTTFVQGGVPSGYQEGALDVGASRVGDVLVVPEKMYVGSAFNVFRYRVENAGYEPIELNESSFHEDGVRAVAFWRHARLAVGESTRVFIITDRRVD